jgi:hypothetical protein
MIRPSDESYQATKRIKQGKVHLAAPFDELAKWIADRWQVVVLNVIYDARNDLHAPRLQVVLEHRKDEETFREGPNFDSYKQELIATKFIELCNRSPSQQRDVNGLFTVFSAFAPLAAEEADGKLTDRQIEEIQRRLGNSDLWCISRCFGEVTFMFYTDQQVAKYSADGKREAYAREYFAILKPLDEFDYLTLDDFTVRFDSKESFDRHYQGSWFNYYR